MKVHSEDAPIPKEGSRLLVLVTAAALAALLVGAAWFDHAFGVTAFWQVPVALALLAGLLVLPLALAGRRGAALLLWSGFAVAVAVLAAVSTSPVKPFLRLARDVEPGMPRHAVYAAMERRFPEERRFRQPAVAVRDGSPVLHPPPDMSAAPDETIQFTLDPDDGRYNAEWFIVYLHEGIVVGEDYSGD